MKKTLEHRQPARADAKRIGGAPGITTPSGADLMSLSRQLDGSSSVVAQAKLGRALQCRAQRGPTQRRSALPPTLASGIERLSGVPMEDVKVHYDSPAPAQLHALAFAQGTDIHLAPGQDRQLPHEAWHVVQQKQNRVAPTMALNGTAINDQQGLEAEADRMGARAQQLGTRPPAQLRSMPSAGPGSQARGTVQLGKCGDCGGDIDREGNGHKSWCHPAKEPMMGGSHDDGSGYQHSGSGGDRHERGRDAAEKAQNRKGFYGQVKKKTRRKTQVKKKTGRKKGGG